METEEFYSKCNNATLENLLQCWQDSLSGEQIRVIRDILEERKNEKNDK